MTRHIHNLEAYSKANAKTILSKVQEVVTNEMNRSNLFNHTNNNPNDNTTNDSHDSCATTQSSSQEHSQEPSQQQSKSQQSQQPPFFQLKELRFGRIIGRGGFCIVRELNEIQLMQSSTSNGDASSRQQLANQVGASSSSNHNSRQTKRKQQQRRYVVKQVDPNTTNRIHLLKGTIDIAFEIKYLASFQHRNIISVRGISSDDYNTNDRSDASNNTIDNNTDHSNGSNRIYYPAVTPEKKIIGTYSTRYSNINEYFIIMEQLDDILNKKLYHWMKLHRTTLGVTGYITSSMEALCCSCKNTNPSMTRSMKLLVERLFVAYDISDAMNYLHSKNIIYRDLKPDNVGFDQDGVVKLFDFGLAKELYHEDMNEDGLYHMTGVTGAIRYMAPEVGLSQPYNLKADVYSWSMLFWYIMALEPPMGMYTYDMFMNRVFQKQYRPAIYDTWSPTIGALMKDCWSPSIHSRPSFDEILRILRAEINAVDPMMMIKDLSSKASSTGNTDHNDSISTHNNFYAGSAATAATTVTNTVGNDDDRTTVST